MNSVGLTIRAGSGGMIKVLFSLFDHVIQSQTWNVMSVLVFIRSSDSMVLAGLLRSVWPGSVSSSPVVGPQRRHQVPVAAAGLLFHHSTLTLCL